MISLHCLADLAEEAALRGTSRTADRGRFLEYTEGRDDWTDANGKTHHYGWCGDFVTWALSRPVIGVLDGRILNRKEINGTWKPGDNLSRLDRWASATGNRHTDPTHLKRGWAVILNTPNGGHICFFGDWLSATSFKSIDGNGPGAKSGINVRALQPASAPAGFVCAYDLERLQPGFWKEDGGSSLVEPTLQQIAEGGNGTGTQQQLV